MTRRALALVSTLVALVATGCAAGPDGPEAQRILDEVAEAQKHVESMSFAMTMKGTVADQSFLMTIDGAGYNTGENAGDMVMSASVEAPGVPITDFSMISRDGRIFMNIDGSWQELPGGLTADQTNQLQSQLSSFDFSKFVRDVEVESDSVTFLGEPVTKIAGTLDFTGLVEGISGQLGDLGGLGALGGGFAAPPQEALDAIGDIRAILYVSDVTNLVKAMHVEFEISEAGQTATFEIQYSLLSVNEPIDIPEPAIIA